MENAFDKALPMRCVLLLLVTMGTFLLPESLRGDYLVIDVAEGKEATSYPVSRLEKPPSEGWTPEYKTTKIVLAEMKPGTFVHRRALSDDPFISPNKSDSCPVTITQTYYIGVFPVTQRQWELVTGTRPSAFKNEESYAMRPVDSVSYVMIRGRIKGTGYPHSADTSLRPPHMHCLR